MMQEPAPSEKPTLTPVESVTRDPVSWNFLSKEDYRALGVEWQSVTDPASEAAKLDDVLKHRLLEEQAERAAAEGCEFRRAHVVWSVVFWGGVVALCAEIASLFYDILRELR